MERITTISRQQQSSEIYFTWLSQVIAAKWFSEPLKTEVCSIEWQIISNVNDTIKEGLSRAHERHRRHMQTDRQTDRRLANNVRLKTIQKVPLNSPGGNTMQLGAEIGLLRLASCQTPVRKRRGLCDDAIHLFVCLSVYLSVCLSVCLTVCFTVCSSETHTPKCGFLKKVSNLLRYNCYIFIILKAHACLE